MENPQKVALLFNNVYINGVYASDEDKKRFVSDYRRGAVVVKQARFDEESQTGYIQTF